MAFNFYNVLHKYLKYKLLLTLIPDLGTTAYFISQQLGFSRPSPITLGLISVGALILLQVEEEPGERRPRGG